MEGEETRPQPGRRDDDRPGRGDPATERTAFDGPGETSLERRFARLTLFNILSNLTVPLTGFVDTAMLGHLDDIRFLAGVALATLVFDVVYWSLGFLRMSTTGTTAQAVGEEGARAGKVYRVLYRSLCIALAIGSCILLLQVPLRELGFGLLAGEPGVEAAGREYFAARIWAAPATLANFAMLGWFLGRGESGRALAITATGNLANVLFNYIFIMQLGLAARGAGLATLISQYLMLAVAAGFFLASGRPAAWRWRDLLEWSSLRGLLALNRDILVRSLLLSGSIALFTNGGALLGTAVLAANTVLLRLFYMASYLIDGVAFAAESLAGLTKGRRDKATFLRVVRLSMVAGLALAGAFLALLFLFLEPALGLLTDHRDVITLARRYAVWLVPVLLFGAAAFVYDGIFIGLTAGTALRNTMLAATLGVFAPLAALALALGNVDLLWLSLAAFMLARALSLAWAGRRRWGGSSPPSPG